jgi:hypothetical protein
MPGGVVPPENGLLWRGRTDQVAGFAAAWEFKAPELR